MGRALQQQDGVRVVHMWNARPSRRLFSVMAAWPQIAIRERGRVRARGRRRRVRDDAEIAKLLKDKGAEVTESKGVVTALTIKDGSKLTDDDFRQLTRLTHFKMLDLSNCLNDDRLAQLTALVGLEYLQTNLAQITDDGLKPLAQLKSLKNLKFFHPGKSFSGCRARSPGGTAEPAKRSPSPARSPSTMTGWPQSPS